MIKKCKNLATGYSDVSKWLQFYDLLKCLEKSMLYRTCLSGPRLKSVTEHFPKCDSKSPDVRCRCELQEGDTLWCAPEKQNVNLTFG